MLYYGGKHVGADFLKKSNTNSIIKCFNNVSRSKNKKKNNNMQC